MTEQHSGRPVYSRRVPRPSLRRRSSDPFSDSGSRNNFPGLDNAFAKDEDVEATPKMGSRSKRCASRHHLNNSSSSSDRDTSGFLLNESMCSQSSSFLSNSSLDMSIGARAAFTEHLRHIARYGIDGQHSVQEQTSYHELDREWDKLMDGNDSIASWPSAAPSSLPGTGISYMAPVFSVQEDGNESVEIVTDLNVSDYFNSSRVQYLATPEKNKHQQHGATLRSTEHHPLFPSFDEEEKSSECNTSSISHESGMSHIFNAAMGLSEQAQVLQDSFSADVSRISSSEDDEEECHSFPDTSFQQNDERSHTELSTDIRSLIPPIERSPSGRFRDASSACTPKRGSPRRSLFSPQQRNVSFENTLPNFSSLALSPIEGRVGGSEAGRDCSAGGMPFAVDSASPIKKCRTPSKNTRQQRPIQKEDTASFELSLALSPIAARAGSEAGRILRDSSNTTAPFSVDTASPISKLRSPPSRISRHHDGNSISFFNASAISKAPSLFTFMEEESTNEAAATVFDSITSNRKQNDSSMKATTGAASSIDSSLSITRTLPTVKPSKDDIHNYRRQFRTVVPRRVYNDDIIAARDDSYLTPCTDSTSSCTTQDDVEESNTSRSLLESFEAAFLK